MDIGRIGVDFGGGGVDKGGSGMYFGVTGVDIGGTGELLPLPAGVVGVVTPEGEGRLGPGGTGGGATGITKGSDSPNWAGACFL